MLSDTYVGEAALSTLVKAAIITLALSVVLVMARHPGSDWVSMRIWRKSECMSQSRLA